MSIFENEVAFLRRLGKRFRSKEAYLSALEDMYEEGLISRKSLEEIKRIKRAQSIAIPGRQLKNKHVPNRHSHIDYCATMPKAEKIIDSCSNGNSTC